MDFLWQEGTVEAKEKLVKMLFPEGIYFDKPNSVYRTYKVNEVFELTRSILEDYRKTKNGANPNNEVNSVLVGPAPFASKNTEEINAEFESILDYNHFLKAVPQTTPTPT